MAGKAVFMRLVLKCLALVFSSIIFEVALVGPCIMRLTASPLGELGRTGAIIMLFLLTVLVPVICAMLVIGILGGVWIADKKQIGFIIGSFFGFFQLVFLIGRNGISFDTKMVMILIGILATVFSAGLTYIKVSRWRARRSNSPIKCGVKE